MDSKLIYTRAVMIARNTYTIRGEHSALSGALPGTIEAAIKLLFWNEPDFDKDRFTQAVHCSQDALDMRLNELINGR